MNKKYFHRVLRPQTLAKIFNYSPKPPKAHTKVLIFFSAWFILLSLTALPPFPNLNRCRIINPKISLHIFLLWLSPSALDSSHGRVQYKLRWWSEVWDCKREEFWRRWKPDLLDSSSLAWSATGSASRDQAESDHVNSLGFWRSWDEAKEEDCQVQGLHSGR